MIEITYRDDGKRRELTVEGHGPGPEGADIFCAAASALVIGLEKNLEELEYKRTASPGFAMFESSADESKVHFAHCFASFIALEELYPTMYHTQTG